MGDGAEELEDFTDFSDSFLKEIARAPVPSRMPAPGSLLGGRDERRFEVLDALGGGAMGQVFRARDAELQRVVALKFFLPRVAGTKEEALGAMLRQEARAIAQLDHENIVRIFDMGEWGGAPWEPLVPFLVMECLDGESLGSLLSRERPGLRRVLGIMQGVARGLAHAHERHIVHRDLKPSNVFLTRQGTVKLLDFGLAHLLGSGSHVPFLPTAGTPPYMAPEQWRGEPQDARTDLWAAGVMLYELLTGELPYPSVNLEELRARVLSPEPVPSVRERAPELSQEVARLVSLLLEKEPGRRLPSATALAERLHQLETQLGPWREEPHALGPQRRQVALVSCGLVGLARLSEKPDPEDSLEMEEDFHRRCSRVIQRHEGFVTHWLGQEVLACFGYPVAREDDSVRAVRAGLDLLRCFQEEPPRLPGHALSVGVGIHTDAVVFTVSAQQSSGTAPAIQGEAQQIASRLAELAGSGGVAIGGNTLLLVRGAFETEPLVNQDPPGPVGGQRLDAWRVLREREAVMRFERVLATGHVSRMVGRERELRMLLALWEEAREGRGSFVLIRGEAGIGKSRLIQELSSRLSPESAYLVQGQCWPRLESSAFAPVIDLLWRRFFPGEPRVRSRRELRGHLESLLGALGLLREPKLDARYIDGLASLLSPAGAEETPSIGLSLEQRESKRWLLDALRALLLRMAEHRPVLSVMEDLHWADPSTLELLGVMLEHIGKERVLVVLSARTGFEPPWPPRPGFHRLELGRLSEESTSALVREVARGRELPEERLAQLVAKTEGIPLFIEEMARLMIERAPGAIPLTLHELLASRLDALAPRQRTLVWFAAGVGRRFTGALLAALTRRSEAELREDLASLVAAGIFQRDDSEEPGYQFHHALLQDVAWQSLPRGRRREFHRHIAQVLEARFPGVVGAQPEVLAHHYTEAGELERALRYRMRAVTLAFQRSANLEAIVHVRRALALLRSLPDASRRSGEEMMLLNSLGIALMSTQGYGVPEIEQTYTRALELFEQEGESLPYLELLWTWLCTYFISGGRLSLAHELAVRLLTLGQRRGDKRLSAHAYRNLASISRQRGELLESLELLDQARVLSAEESLLAFPLSGLWVDLEVLDSSFICLTRLALGDVRRAWQLGLEALARARRMNHPGTLNLVLVCLTSAAQLHRDVQRTLEWAEEGMLAASRVWLRPSEEVLRGFRGWALARLGRRKEGLEALRKSFGQLRRMEAWSFVPYLQGLLAEVQGSLGQVHEGLASVEEALECMDKLGDRFVVPEMHRIRGELLRLRGENGEAMRCFLRACIMAHRERAALLELRATVALARLLRDTGHDVQARRRLVRAFYGSRVDSEAVDFQDARVLLEQFSTPQEGLEAR
ncbi:protein kinase [Archangium violaceum]|uniref:protein kinase domain-containing protein n=1 Tax=Archangium violaceum TaxID=83451 RepID=UPI00193C75A0|nr:protein kinase [Archangium violaceum]QRK11353.1 protein kinase [Archangium violaceum]